jgi:hypothetical protein
VTECDTRSGWVGKQRCKTTYPTGIPVVIGNPAPRDSCPSLTRQKLKRKTRKDKRPDNSMTDGFFDSSFGFEVRSGR